MKKKKKHRPLCPLCACTQTRTLSTRAAVGVLEFLEAFTENFMAQYGREIHRHYAKRAKRNINVHEPWKGDCTDESFWSLATQHQNGTRSDTGAVLL